MPLTLPPHIFAKEEGRVCKPGTSEGKGNICRASASFGAGNPSGIEHHLHEVMSETKTGRALGNHTACPPPIIHIGTPNQSRISITFYSTGFLFCPLLMSEK